jgi:hypothetical protein
MPFVVRRRRARAHDETVDAQRIRVAYRNRRIDLAAALVKVAAWTLLFGRFGFVSVLLVDQGGIATRHPVELVAMVLLDLVCFKAFAMPSVWRLHHEVSSWRVGIPAPADGKRSDRGGAR